jgi:tetratricopeptide (TPR) repeat protein
MLENLLCGLESTRPDDEGWPAFEKIISESRSVVKQYRESFVGVAVLGAMLMAGSDQLGASGYDVSVRSLRRATKLAKDRMVVTTKLLADAAAAAEVATVAAQTATATASAPTATSSTTATKADAVVSLAWVHEYVRREIQVMGRVHNLLGRQRFHHSDFESAAEALEAAVAVDPRVPEAYEWLARAYDRTQRPDDFFAAWHKALTVDPWASDRNVWPVFCVTIGHPSVPDTPRLSINRERARVGELAQEERSRLHARHRHARHASGHQAPNRFDKLMDIIDAIRALECTPTFVGDRNKAMHDYHVQMKAANPQRDYSYINFAYGMVFFHGFDRLFRNIPVARDAVARIRARDLEWVSFGSNVGTETLYAATTWGVRATGYDVLCNLVSYADKFRDRFHVDNARFFCKDALDADLQNAGVIWIDNQSWDEHLSNAVFAKLNRDLPPGAIVVEYAVSDFHAGAKLYVGNRLDVVGCATLDVSWDNHHGTTVSIFQKRLNDFTGNYYNWGDLAHLVRGHLQSVRRMVDMAKEELEERMQTGSGAEAATEAAAAAAHLSIFEDPLHGPLVMATRKNNEQHTVGWGKGKSTARRRRSPEHFNPMAELLELEAAVREDAAILTVASWTDRVLSLYARTLFNWYCIFFFDLHAHMSGAEIDYIETFAMHHGDEFRAYNLDGSWVGNRMSSYSYSHQLDTGDSGIG